MVCYRIVDTNVAVVAEGLADHVSGGCMQTCIELLSDIMSDGILLLDSPGDILSEYLATLGHSGQPGIGKAFAKWVFNYQFDSTKCLCVDTTALECNGWRQYEEVPNDVCFQTFDRSDQKFLAVAVAGPQPCLVVNATDSDWANHHVCLIKHGVNIKYLCPKECSPSSRTPT